MSLLKFLERFGTEAACREPLFHARWADGFCCPRCSGSKAYPLARRHLWQCAACGYQASVTAGTVMLRSHLPLTKWFITLYLAAQSKRGVSALELAKKLDVGYRIAWALLHKVRAAMADAKGNTAWAALSSWTTRTSAGQRWPRGPRHDEGQDRRRGEPHQRRLSGLRQGDRRIRFHARNRDRGYAWCTGARHDRTHRRPGAFNGRTDAGFVHRPMPNPQLPEGIEPCPYVHTLISNAKAWIAAPSTASTGSPTCRSTSPNSATGTTGGAWRTASSIASSTPAPQHNRWWSPEQVDTQDQI